MIFSVRLVESHSPDQRRGNCERCCIDNEDGIAAKQNRDYSAKR
jgi:hypothetical protein